MRVAARKAFVAAATLAGGALLFVAPGPAASFGPAIVPGQSLGGVPLGASQTRLEVVIGAGARSHTRTSDRPGAFDETYGAVRVTYVPCRAGHCIAAVATSSTAFETTQGVRVRSPIRALVEAYPGRRCGRLPGSSHTSQPDGYCTIGFEAGDTGTTFLTIEDAVSHRRVVETIAVARPETRWNIDVAAGIVGPTRTGSSNRSVIIGVILLVMLALLVRMAWLSKRGSAASHERPPDRGE